jgi:hypothetical protein
MFVLSFPSAPDGDRVFLRRPSLNLKESACTPFVQVLERVRSARRGELHPHTFAECCRRYIVDAWEHVQDITSGALRVWQ